MRYPYVTLRSNEIPKRDWFKHGENAMHAAVDRCYILIRIGNLIRDCCVAQMRLGRELMAEWPEPEAAWHTLAV